MGSYNGLIGSLTKDGSSAADLLSGVSFITVGTAVPNKYFSHGQFAIACTEGVSGTFAVDVIGAVAGATFIIAGRTNISSVGSFPVPTLLYGQSGNYTGIGIPRPIGINFISGSTWAVGFTASVYLAAEY